MVNTGPFGEDQLLLLSHSGTALPGSACEAHEYLAPGVKPDVGIFTVAG